VHLTINNTSNATSIQNGHRNQLLIMKICAACHKDLPKESYSKKQLKLDQRRCKVCITNNREVQEPPPQQDNNDTADDDGLVKLLDSMYLDGEKKISDEELFKQPPPPEDCPICFLRIPNLNSGWRYQLCCGKQICMGCYYAPLYDNQGKKVDNKKCPFCRTPPPKTSGGGMERYKKRVEANDPIAIYNLGCYYAAGENGFPQDYPKALELYDRAGGLGFAAAYNNIGYAYDFGKVVKVDKKKSTHYYELAAMRGNVYARHNLGYFENMAGNIDRALMHYMIAVKGGYSRSLNSIKDLYSNRQATKVDYAKALQSYQEYLSEIKSPQRDKAVAYDNEEYRYY